MNYFKFKPKDIALVAVVGIASWYGGKYYEKKNLHFNHLNNKAYDYQRIIHSDMPVFSTVSAATISNPPKDSEKSIVPTGKLNFYVPGTDKIMRYGFPSLTEVPSVLLKDDFLLSYDTRNKVAHWVLEHLTAERLKVKDNVDRSKCNFMEDKSVHKFFRATNEDYKGSGFDRGHLAAAGNHRLEQNHCDQTFHLTNIAPQVGNGFNRHAWNRLEKYVRKLTKHYRNVFVCTGPLYLARTEADGKRYVKYQVIGINEVAVPTHFFKVIVMETEKGEYHLESYMMPNAVIDDEIPLKAFYVPYESIEMHSGLLFFDQQIRNRFVTINGKKS